MSGIIGPKHGNNSINLFTTWNFPSSAEAVHCTVYIQCANDNQIIGPYQAKGLFKGEIY